MTGCEPLAASAATGVAPALRAVDCLANQTTAAAFARLFGGNGALTPALTILLTLYIAFFAVSLLTGRSRIGISALTPKMMTLGLVLTFATSWIAYQSVIWNLAIGGPDQIAGAITGAPGPATKIFADRIDLIFAAITEVATSSGQSSQGAGAGITSGSFTPANVMWLGALLLLLGTVGVLVTARITLAVLLAVGPVFVVLGLFSGTRGLTAGWIRALALSALMPMFVVIGGGMVMELLVPIVSALNSSEGQIDGRAAIALFLVSAVHIALMSMIGKAAAAMISGWSVFGLSSTEHSPIQSGGTAGQATLAMSSPVMLDQSITPAGSRRSQIVAGNALPVEAAGQQGDNPAAPRNSQNIVNQYGGEAATSVRSQPTRRTHGIGNRFQSRTTGAQGRIR